MVDRENVGHFYVQGGLCSRIKVVKFINVEVGLSVRDVDY